MTSQKKISQRIGKALMRGLDQVMTYIWINMTAVVSNIFFRVLNRTEIIGRENIPHDRSVLLCSNHQTMIDSFLIGAFAFFPKVLYKPQLLPYHPAALENFFKGRIMTWMSRKWRCIPVKRGERDMLALSTMIKSLKNGTMVLFPEGTRSRNGRIGVGRVGVGKLIYDTRATVIPVAIQGMNKVLPIGSKYPRFFKKIRVIYGEPVDLSEYLAMEPGKATSRVIVDTVVDEISELYAFLGTKEYLDKAQKISNPRIREREIAELSRLHGEKIDAVIDYAGTARHLPVDEEQAPLYQKEHIH